MVERRLKGGRVAYYWTPRRKDLDMGFGITGEALGDDYAAAIARAEMLNGHLDAWRGAKGAKDELDHGDDDQFGSVKWLFAQYRASEAFKRISDRTRPVYLRGLRQLEEVPTKDNRRVGDLNDLAAGSRQNLRGAAGGAARPSDATGGHFDQCGSTRLGCCAPTPLKEGSAR